MGRLVWKIQFDARRAVGAKSEVAGVGIYPISELYETLASSSREKGAVSFLGTLHLKSGTSAGCWPAWPVLKNRINFRFWHIASFRCRSGICSLSGHGGHRSSRTVRVD